MKKKENKAVRDDPMKINLRDNQPSIVENILNSFRDGTKVVVLNAPTGVGKSIINMMVTKELVSGYTTTPLRTLVDQYKDTILHFDEDELGWVIMGRGAYPCPHLIDNENKRFARLPEEDRDLESVIRSHEYRLKLMTSEGAPCSDKNPKYYVGEGNGTTGKKKQFTTKCPMRDECPYYKDRDKAMVSQNAISTFDYFMYGIYSALKRSTDSEDGDSTAWQTRDILTIDEAHSLPNKLVDFFTITVSERTLPGFPRDMLIKKIEEMKKTLEPKDNSEFSKKVSEIFSKMLTEYMNLQDQEMDYLETLAEENDEDPEVEYEGRKMPLEDAIRKHKKFLYKLKFVRSSVSSDVEFVYHSDDTGIYLKPYSAKPYMEPLWEMFDYILLSSATFFDVELYLSDLGLDKYKWKLIDVPSSFDPQKGPIVSASNIYLNRKNFSTTTPKVIEKVDEIMDHHPDEKGMIHCFSSTYRSAIMNGSERKERLVTHDSFNRNEVLKDFTSSTEGNKVLVSVNMGEEVDLKDDIARFQIIVKAPFLPLGDPWIALHRERSERWYKSQTIIELMQMAGRVVRSKEDHGITYIIDKNAWNLLEQNRNLLPSWFVQRMDAGQDIRKKKMDSEMDDLMNEMSS